MKYFLLAALLTLPSTWSHAAFIEDVDVNLAVKNAEAASKAVANKILRENDQDYRRDALTLLKEKGEYFDIGRVEVTGFMSKDNTDKELPGLADRQIKPSISAHEYSGLAADAWKWLKWNVDPDSIVEKALEIGVDYKEVKAAMRGEVTKRAKVDLAPYKGKEINEIVAHSWGTELVYAAILNGDILPPKKLIVVGVPDDDHAKWELLAAITGTEVHWVRSVNDKMAKKGAALAQKTVSEYGVSFEALWRGACRDRPETCPAHNRQSSIGVFWDRIGDNPGTAGHDRIPYYRMLTALGIIKGSRHDLASFQNAKVAAETRRIETSALDAALDEARGLVEQVREQQEIARRDNEEREAQDKKGRLWENVDLDEFKRRMAELKTHLPVAAIVRVESPPPFSSVFARLKDFAESACRAPEQLPARLIFFKTYDLSYWGYDDEQARLLSSGMGTCPRQLFNNVIARTRTNRGLLDVDGDWTKATVAEYLRAPEENSTGTIAPYTGGGRAVEPTESTPPPPVVHDAGGEALDQLIIEEEIARRKRWGLRPIR